MGDYSHLYCGDFAMNISIRGDIKELYVEPQAQNVVTKLYVQHRAAMNYISKRNRNSTAPGLSYQPGELTADMLEADLPYGFQYDSGVSTYKTWVYCLDKDKLENSGAAAPAGKLHRRNAGRSG